METARHYLTRGLLWAGLSLAAYGIIGYFVDWVLGRIEHAGIETTTVDGFAWLFFLRSLSYVLAAGAIAGFALLAAFVASGRLERADRLYALLMTYFVGALGMGVLAAAAVYLFMTRLSAAV